MGEDSNPGLSELSEHARDFAESMREVAKNLERQGKADGALVPASGRTAKGRPSRAEQVDPQLVAEAPFRELVLEPANQLVSRIRRIDDVDLLTSAHQFEMRHDRRKSVLDRIEHRLHRLGQPLGGPEAPFDNYENLDPQEVIARLQNADADIAAQVFAFEHYHSRRKQIMVEARDICGAERADQAVADSSPRAQLQRPPEPFPGYDSLSASTEGRAAVRKALAPLSVTQLENALAYETATRQRTIMIQAITTALNRARSRDAKR